MNYIQFLHQMHLDQHYQLEHRMNNVELALCNLFLILLSIGIGSLMVIKTVWEPMRKDGEFHYDDEDLKYESYLDKYPIHEYIRACREFDDDEDDTSGSEYETSGDEEEEYEDEDSRGKNILIENTPEGTVFMNYNHEKEGFNYWSNTQIPFEYINSVARKYVITFDCVEFYVLSEEEKKLVDGLQENDSEDKEDGEKDGEKDGEVDGDEDGEENQKENKSDDDDYEKIIQSELEDVDKATKNKEEDAEKDAEKDAESSEDESSEESSSEEEDEREKKLHNKFIYQGNIRNLDILNKKSFEKNNSKSFSFADFMKMQSN